MDISNTKTVVYVTIGVTLVNIATKNLEAGSNHARSLHFPERIYILTFIYLKK